jgi:hypothetical protein
MPIVAKALNGGGRNKINKMQINGVITIKVAAITIIQNHFEVKIARTVLMF